MELGEYGKDGVYTDTTDVPDTQSRYNVSGQETVICSDAKLTGMPHHRK